MCSRDSLHIPEGYSTCTSNNNKSQGRRNHFMTKIVQRLQISYAIIKTWMIAKMEEDVIKKAI